LRKQFLKSDIFVIGGVMNERRVFSAEEMKQIRILFADGCNLRQICDIFGIQPYEARAAILGPEYIAEFDDPGEFAGEFKRGGVSQVEIECINLLFSRGMPKKKIIRLFQREPAQIDSILSANAEKYGDYARKELSYTGRRPAASRYEAYTKNGRMY
jgi:hypothetical protein